MIEENPARKHSRRDRDNKSKISGINRVWLLIRLNPMLLTKVKTISENFVSVTTDCRIIFTT